MPMATLSGMTMFMPMAVFSSTMRKRFQFSLVLREKAVHTTRVKSVYTMLVSAENLRKPMHTMSTPKEGR